MLHRGGWPLSEEEQENVEQARMRIRRMARKHGVPMVENKPLARSLYKTVKVGKPVPSRFYRAVAEVLAYVYRIRKSRRPVQTDSVTTNRARSDQ